MKAKKINKNVISNGYVDVENEHKLYYEQWGNENAEPIFFLHGGPGGEFKYKHTLTFDPDKHHVIFFDQRGSGESKPYASTKNNTTQDLISDIEILREKFKFEKIKLWGRSWGSALALAYAVEHPNRVSRMAIGGIYLGTRVENDFISEGYVRFAYPEAWERFISFVPVEHRKSGTSITQYYSDKMHSKDEEEAKTYADEWTLWEATTVVPNYNRIAVESDVYNSDNLAIARLETHYFLNDCFMEKDHILNNIDKIKDIPCYVVQGRYDNCTPPETAYKLSEAYGDKLTLQWVSAGHAGSDSETQAVNKAVANTFLV